MSCSWWIALFFVGTGGAALRRTGHYRASPDHPLHLAEARPVGEVVLLRYLAAAAPCRTPGRTPARRRRG
jgi:hypothetical protein